MNTTSPPPDDPRRRLLTTLRPRGTRGQLIAALLCAVLGFAVAVQVRANQQAGLSGLRQTDLVRILDDTSERAARLESEARQLEQTRSRLASGADGTRAALEETRKRVETLAILAGTAPAVGPGIQVEIPDPRREVTADVLLDALQELRDAGAEAIQIGTVRAVASTALVDTPQGVTVDGVRLEPPYRLLVIGDPRTLASALDIPGGVLEVLRSRYGVSASVRQRQDRDGIRIDALRVPKAPEYARPAPEATG
jgi:uncharacterized protein YlxW (UPF0749 family)